MHATDRRDRRSAQLPDPHPQGHRLAARASTCPRRERPASHRADESRGARAGARDPPREGTAARRRERVPSLARWLGPATRRDKRVLTSFRAAAGDDQLRRGPRRFDQTLRNLSPVRIARPDGDHGCGATRVRQKRCQRPLNDRTAVQRRVLLRSGSAEPAAHTRCRQDEPITHRRICRGEFSWGVSERQRQAPTDRPRPAGAVRPDRRSRCRRSCRDRCALALPAPPSPS